MIKILFVCHDNIWRFAKKADITGIFEAYNLILQLIYNKWSLDTI